MKRTLLLLAILLTWLAGVTAQQKADKPFRAHLANKEYEVFMHIDFYDQCISVPGQELYGELPGYLGKEHNNFCWVITSAKLKNDRTAIISLINDYGSEDLTASLVCQDDSTYVLKQLDGSALKVPKNGHWQKLPRQIELKRK